MQFLSDVYVTCPTCNGARFRADVLEVQVQRQVDPRGARPHGAEDCGVLRRQRRCERGACSRCSTSGSATSGSASRSRRCPAASRSASSSPRRSPSHPAPTSRPLFLFDEPTIGLHFADVEKLLAALQRLVERGHSVVVIEHNMEVAKTADWVIDLGPDGGDGGGRLSPRARPKTSPPWKDRTPAAIFARRSRDSPRRRHAGAARPAPTVLRRNGAGLMRIVGAKEHNLRASPPRPAARQFIVVTGLTGSGKSTLAFDIVYAEGQRRYLDSLSTYARQYVKVLAAARRRPARRRAGDGRDRAAHSAAAAASRRSRRSPRSTTTCACSTPRSACSTARVRRGAEPAQSASRSWARIKKEFGVRTATLLAPAVRGRKGIYKELLQAARKLGFEQARIDGKPVALQPIPRWRAIRSTTSTSSSARSTSARATERRCGARRRALRLGSGTVPRDAGHAERLYSERLYCGRCGVGYEALDPRLFSFNSRQGACRLRGHRQRGDLLSSTSSCSSTPSGRSAKRCYAFQDAPLDRHRAGPRRARALKVPLATTRSSSSPNGNAKALCAAQGTQAACSALLRSCCSRTRTSGSAVADLLGERPCPSCAGRRLNARAQAVRVRGRTIWDVTAGLVADARAPSAPTRSAPATRRSPPTS